MYSTLLEMTKFWYSDADQKDKLWFEVSTDVIALKGYSKTSQWGMFAHSSTAYRKLAFEYGYIVNYCF